MKRTLNGPRRVPVPNTPIVIVSIWWSVCFSFYALRWPIPYEHVNFYLVAALFLGTLILSVAAFTLISRQAQVHLTLLPGTKMPKEMKIAFLMTIALHIPLVSAYSGFQFWEVLPALADQNGAYYMATAMMENGLGSRWVVVAAQTLFAPLTMALLPFLALEWFDRRRYFGALVVTLVLSVSMSILTGRDFQLFLSILIVACAWLVSRMRRRIGIRRLDLAVILTVAGTFIYLSGIRKSDRTLGASYCPPGVSSCSFADPPTVWESIAVTFASYASQGFEGMGRALNATWNFGGGIGHAPAVRNIFDAVFGSSNEYTVSDQLDGLGWSSSGLWSTGLTMIANDVPWALIPFVIVGQAALMAFAWRCSISKGDWLSIAVFSYSLFTLIFMPMTLQLATSGPLYLGYVALSAWFILREVSYGQSRAHAHGGATAVSGLNSRRSFRRRLREEW